jgi:two-component system, NarL family, invasion response regulator UvrY
MMTASETKGISILLVDDHPVVRQGYRRVLEHQGDFRVVAEAENAANAYLAFKTHAPDIVVMDISMPGASGLEAIRNIRSWNSATRILVFSAGEGRVQRRRQRLRDQGQRTGRTDQRDPRRHAR